MPKNDGKLPESSAENNLGRQDDMKTQRVGSRGFLFTFEEPYETNVYVICSKNSVFVCDTFLGPDPMDKVKQHLEKNNCGSKHVVVFNSHADYDHYWGNCSFKKTTIIGHGLCRKRILNESENDLKDFKEHKQGRMEIVAPNLVFSERIFFADEGVEFYFTPGHTRDSASCFDQVDKVLFVGDNVESPFPHLNEPNYADYAATMKEYIARKAKTILSGHDAMMTDYNLLKANMEYVRKFKTLSIDTAKLDKKAKIIHFMNLTNVGAKLKEKRKFKEALRYYEKSKTVLDQLDDATQGKKEQMKKVQDKIKELIRIVAKKDMKC